MNDESKKIEKIEQEEKQEVTEVKPAELSEQELDKVAGGAPQSMPCKDWGTNPPAPAPGPVGQIINGLNATLAAAGVKV